MEPAVVQVEALIFAEVDGDVVYWRLIKQWDEGAEPEDALPRPPGTSDEDCYEHSTSWRSLGSRSIVLTYAVIPKVSVLAEYVALAGKAPTVLVDPNSLPASRQVDSSVPADQVAIQEIPVARVAWHASRHLSFLARSDESGPHLSGFATDAFWERIRRQEHSLAGRLE